MIKHKMLVHGTTENTKIEDHEPNPGRAAPALATRGEFRYVFPAQKH